MIASKQGQDDPAWKLSSNLYETYQCRMYSRKRLMMGTTKSERTCGGIGEETNDPPPTQPRLLKDTGLSWFFSYTLSISTLLLNTQSYLCFLIYEGWNFNSGNYLFKTDTK